VQDDAGEAAVTSWAHRCFVAAEVVQPMTRTPLAITCSLHSAVKDCISSVARFAAVISSASRCASPEPAACNAMAVLETRNHE
jgi:hypothetical protein